MNSDSIGEDRIEEERRERERVGKWEGDGEGVYLKDWFKRN